MNINDAVNLAKSKLTTEEKEKLNKIEVNKEIYQKILVRITSLVVYSEY